MILAFLLAAAPVGTALDAEHAFARDAQTIGQWTAFRKYADDEAVMFTPQPVRAHEFLKDRKDPQQALEWWPDQSFVSCDGGVAVNAGPAFRPTGEHYGRFSTVWVRKDGGWKWVYDNGSDPAGAPSRKPGEAKVARASCLGKATGAPIAQPSPAASPESSGHGESPDKTLGWDWKVEANGAHHLRVFLWNGRGYDEALSVRVAGQ